jgi:hypothetical protein
MENPTSIGMRSGSLAQVATRKLSMSTPSLELGAESNTKQEEPRMAWTTSSDQTCARRLDSTMRTLHLNGLNKAPTWQRQCWNTSRNSMPGGGGV